MLFRSLFASAMCFGALFLNAVPSNAQVKKQSQKAANEEEVITYVNISIATFCEARGQKVDFQKSMAIAVAAQGYPIFSKHGGLVPGSTKPLDEKRFIGNASYMVMAGSMQFCPKMIPAAEKAKFEKAAASLKPAKK